MTALTHQPITRRINRRAELDRENARMDEIERYAAPLFYAVMICAAAVVLWILTSGYRDVWQHRLDTMADRQQYDRISETLVRCAKGEIVKLDGDYMTCNVKPLELVSLK